LKLNSIEIIYCFKVYVIYLAEKKIAVLTDFKRVILDKLQAYHNNSWGQWSLLFVNYYMFFVKNHCEKTVSTVMVNNINKKNNNYFSLQIIEHKKYHAICWWKSMYWLGHVTLPWMDSYYWYFFYTI